MRWPGLDHAGDRRCRVEYRQAILACRRLRASVVRRHSGERYANDEVAPFHGMVVPSRKGSQYALRMRLDRRRIRDDHCAPVGGLGEEALQWFHNRTLREEAPSRVLTRLPRRRGRGGRATPRDRAPLLFSG